METNFKDFGNVEFVTNTEYRKKLNEIFLSIDENYKLKWFYELAVEKTKRVAK